MLPTKKQNKIEMTLWNALSKYQALFFRVQKTQPKSLEGVVNNQCENYESKQQLFSVIHIPHPYTVHRMGLGLGHLPTLLSIFPEKHLSRCYKHADTPAINKLTHPLQQVLPQQYTQNAQGARQRGMGAR